MDSRAKAGEIGCLEAVVKAIDTHISNVVVCGQCCGALGNMSLNG